jgi:hypothetical protein
VAAPGGVVFVASQKNRPIKVGIFLHWPQKIFVENNYDFN